jgi:hypothetical protein
MQITSYDKHVRLLSSVALVVASPSLPLGRSRRRYGINKTGPRYSLATPYAEGFVLPVATQPEAG